MKASGTHDVGGTSGVGAIPREQHAFLPWEVRVDALMWLLTDRARPGGPLLTVDRLRRGIEELDPEHYRSLGYYQKWLLSLIEAMRERGLVTDAGLSARLHAAAAAHERDHGEHDHHHDHDGRDHE